MNLGVTVQLLGPCALAALDGLVPLRRQGPVIDPLGPAQNAPAPGSRSRPIAPATPDRSSLLFQLRSFPPNPALFNSRVVSRIWACGLTLFPS